MSFVSGNRVRAFRLLLLLQYVGKISLKKNSLQVLERKILSNIKF